MRESMYSLSALSEMRFTTEQCYFDRVLNTGSELTGLSLPNGRGRKPDRDTSLSSWEGTGQIIGQV